MIYGTLRFFDKLSMKVLYIMEKNLVILILNYHKNKYIYTHLIEIPIKCVSPKEQALHFVYYLPLGFSSHLAAILKFKI